MKSEECKNIFVLYIIESVEQYVLYEIKFYKHREKGWQFRLLKEISTTGPESIKINIVY